MRGRRYGPRSSGSDDLLQIGNQSKRNWRSRPVANKPAGAEAPPSELTGGYLYGHENSEPYARGEHSHAIINRQVRGVPSVQIVFS